MVGDRYFGGEDVGPQQIALVGGIEEGELGMEFGAIARAVFVVEAGAEVDERAVRPGVERDVLGHQRARLEAVGVDVGPHPVAFGVEPALQVAQEIVLDGEQFGGEAALHVVVDQVDTHAAAVGHVDVGSEEVEQVLQVEGHQAERSERFRILLVLVPCILVEQVVDVVFHHPVQGLLHEIGDEDVAVVLGAGDVGIEGQEIAIVFLRGEQGQVADVEVTLAERGHQVADVDPAEEGAFRLLDDVGVERHPDRGTVALVEMERVEVGVIEVEVDDIVAVLALAAHFGVGVGDELQVGIVAHHIGLQQAVLEAAGGQQVVVIIAVEREVVDFEGLDADVEGLAGRREVDVGLARQRAERRIAQDAAQLQRFGAGVAVDLHPARCLPEGSVERGCAHRGGGQMAGELQVG